MSNVVKGFLLFASIGCTAIPGTFAIAATPASQQATADATTSSPTTAPAIAPATAPSNLSGYLVATQPRGWSFPKDHGRHDGYKTEWWYFTGNLVDDAGRPFGYQLTFFRASVSPIAVARDSVLSLGDYYFAHAAISDLAGGPTHEGNFYFKDRLEREAGDQTTSAADTLDVKLRDWSAKLTPAKFTPAKPSDPAEISLEAADAKLGIHLTCQTGDGPAAPVLQGPGGINRKGAGPTQASYYYSIPRLATRGTLEVNGQTFHVTGTSWMDHEFSSNVLGPNQIGWDWVGLHLADGNSLMVYRLRNREGGADYLSGTLIDQAGLPRYLADTEIQFAGASPWKSESGGAYPQVWSLNVKGLGPLTIRSRMPGQELRTAATTKIDYFEGACSVTAGDGQPAGEGYLEMTGYAKPLTPF